MKRFAVLLAVVVSALFAGPAAQVTQAAIPEVFDGHGDITCTVQGAGANAGERWCGTGTSSPLSRSTAPTFDGVPIDVNVAFPPAPPSGPDGPYPLMMVFHGYPQSKVTFENMQRWVNRGYAVFSMTDRGLHESCGSVASKLAAPAACNQGFVRLLDTRYEVRDAQTFAGLLADEGLIQPKRIAASGGSYGGAVSMALAALKNRTMLLDGSLQPWQSPGGKPMELAVAIPYIPWTDLAYSLAPNGGTLDYLKDAPYKGRFGVMKESWVNLLYTLGLTIGEGTYAPSGDPSADLTGWKAVLDAGEPYEGKPAAQAILDDLKAHHSSYYIDHSIAPAPIHITSGFTDDLFPVDEAIRFYNRTKAQYPDTPVGLMFGPNSGHMRGMSKADVTAAEQVIENKWVDYYLKDSGPKPPTDVVAYKQTCPADASAGEPYTASNWASISPGEIRVTDSTNSQKVSPTSGDAAVGLLFNPAPTGMACTTAPGAVEAGSADYVLPKAPAGGYTVLGSPTLVAKIDQAGTSSQIAARLVDVSPDGTTKLLVARALWRPASSGIQVFQLHANAWHVEEGHVLRLELLAKDAGLPAGSLLTNYGRPSNDQTEATVSDVDFRVPVAEQPGALGGLVTKPAPKVLPPGGELAPGYGSTGSVPIDDYVPPGNSSPTVTTASLIVKKLTARGRKLRATVKCNSTRSFCPKTSILVKKGKMKIATARNVRVRKGKRKVISMKVTHQGKKLLARTARSKKPGSKRIKVSVRIKMRHFGPATHLKSSIRVIRKHHS